MSRRNCILKKIVLGDGRSGLPHAATILELDLQNTLDGGWYFIHRQLALMGCPFSWYPFPEPTSPCPRICPSVTVTDVGAGQT